MNIIAKIFIIYLSTMNLLSFLLMGVDKYKSRHNLWRISQKKLFFVSLIGGAVGSVLGMKIFRHKISKLKFKIVMALITIINIFFYGILIDKLFYNITELI